MVPPPVRKLDPKNLEAHAGTQCYSLPPSIRKINSKGTAVLNALRASSRLLRFWVKVPNTSSEIGTTLSRARACGRKPRHRVPGVVWRRKTGEPRTLNSDMDVAVETSRPLWHSGLYRWRCRDHPNGGWPCRTGCGRKEAMTGQPQPKFISDRRYVDSAAAMARILELAKGAEADKGRISLGPINRTLLNEGASVEEYRAGLARKSHGTNA